MEVWDVSSGEEKKKGDEIVLCCEETHEIYLDEKVYVLHNRNCQCRILRFLECVHLAFLSAIQVLGERVQHHLIDLTEVWNEVGAKKFIKDAIKYRGHWVGCLGCQESMATHLIIHSLERRIANAFICSSVGGEYASMSMAVTREKNAEFYARYGIRYNAPLLDLGISKPEERAVLAQHDIEAGWGARRSHQGFQPICVLGFQHALDIVFDWHTTYPPDRVADFLDAKFEIMDLIIRRTLEYRGHDPDQAIAETKAIYDAEEREMELIRARQAAG